MIYKVLPENLRDVADRVVDYLREDRGVTSFRAEAAIDDDLEYRPTAHGFSPEKYIVAVEVQDRPDIAVLDSTVLDCAARSLPVKIFIAFPEPAVPISTRDAEKIHHRGVGLIEVRPAGPVVLREALPMSLFGYRLDRQIFPQRLRGTLLDAENALRSNNPPHGCSILHQEVEDLSRKIIAKTKEKKMWRKLKPSEKTSKLNLDTGAWEKVLELFEGRYVVNKKKVPDLTSNLIHRIEATTLYRNQGAHKPKTTQERKDRDRETRTRFESAADLLHDLLRVSSQIK
jgi:hypothetical protein